MPNDENDNVSIDENLNLSNLDDGASDDGTFDDGSTDEPLIDTVAIDPEELDPLAIIKKEVPTHEEIEFERVDDDIFIAV